VMRVTGKYRLPEPIRFAHNAAGGFDPNKPNEPTNDASNATQSRLF
jgi:hypothetical protein